MNPLGLLARGWQVPKHMALVVILGAKRAVAIG